MKPIKRSVSFLLLIVMLMGLSLIAQDNAMHQETSVKTEFGVDGEIMINGNGVSGKISIGTDTSKNGVIGYSFTLNWIRGFGSGGGGKR